MTYSVKEMYFTLQGEGARTGRPAVFLRFAGCNLWSGREKDRARAICRFCDTGFVGTDGPGGGKYSTAEALAAAARRVWSQETAGGVPYVVCTGGEPLLQLDGAAVAALSAQGFEIGLETNGTLPAPAGIDWVTVSPKAGTELVQRNGDELKLVYPQKQIDPSRYESLAFRHFFLQPLDDPEQPANLRAAAEYCRRHPRWKLSLQTHKIIGIA